MRGHLWGWLVYVVLIGIGTPVAGQQASDRGSAIRAVIQAQADAFNRGDLEGTMATLGRNVDWRTIQGDLLVGHAAVRQAMTGWIEGLQGNDVRLVYPPETVSVQVLSEDYAVADVVLNWDPGPGRRGGVEHLFFVLERADAGWVIAHVRNTTTHACAAAGSCADGG